VASRPEGSPRRREHQRVVLPKRCSKSVVVMVAEPHRLDYNPDGIAYCRKRHTLPGLDFVHGDAEKLPFPDDSFDAVINVEASHAYPQLSRFLSEVARVLRPYMIPADDLPLLDPLRLIPFVGNPLADLLQPDLEVLVNLGYGSITDGWSQGPANVETPFGLFPTDLDWNDVLTALANGAQQGIQDAISDLENPDNYQITPLLDNPSLSALVDAAYTAGLIDTLQPTSLELTEATLGGSFPVSDVTLQSPLTDIVNDFTSTLSADYASLVPIADTINALTTSLPAYDATLFADQLEAGNLLGAIGDPIAADFALVPFAIFLGAGPIADAVEGTLLNLVNLIP
jgi:SAM-dependent methyltransferase